MNLLYVTPEIGWPPRSGPHLRVYHTLRTLTRYATVHLYGRAPLPSAAIRHFESWCRTVRFAPSTGGPARDWLQRRPLRVDWQDVRDLRGIVRRESIDVVWLGYGNISYPLILLKLLAPCRLVVDTDSVWSRYVLREAPFTSSRRWRARIAWAGWLKRLEEIIGTSIADVTAAVSEVDARYYRALTPWRHRVRLLSNVIDPEAYAGSSPPPEGFRRPALCLTGSMASAAVADGAEWLVGRVLPRLHPSPHLYLVGKEPGARIRALAGPHVTVTGEVDSVLPYLRHADAAVVPLRFESGTRFKILEAFACGTPVVSTRLGAEGLAVVGGEHLLLADTPEAFAAALRRLRGEPSLRGRLAEAGGRLVRERYSLEAAGRQVQQILREVTR